MLVFEGGGTSNSKAHQHKHIPIPFGMTFDQWKGLTWFESHVEGAFFHRFIPEFTHLGHMYLKKTLHLRPQKCTNVL